MIRRLPREIDSLVRWQPAELPNQFPVGEDLVACAQLRYEKRQGRMIGGHPIQLRQIRLYRNSPRTLSHPPVTLSPDVTVCLDCGWSVFSIPQPWLSAGWLTLLKKQPTATVTSISAMRVASSEGLS